MIKEVPKILGDAQTKKRWRLIARRRRKDAKDLTLAADQQIEKLLIRRFDRLVSVRRFIFLWIALFGVLFFATVVQIRALSKYYQSLQPVAGGLYSEGIIGSFTNANPLYSNGTADAAVSRLVFSGLFKYDTKNRLTGDLAEGWEVSANGRSYSVTLRENVKWHDGRPFTADDVVFTYQTITDPDAQSYLYTSWQGTKIAKKDSRTVVFELPSQLAAFPHALTNGIVPKHLLGDTPTGQLRSAAFNTAPIGTGPFVWKFVEVSGVTAAERQQLISLSANKDYWGGQPKLDGISITTFYDETHMLDSFLSEKINAMSGLESIPDEIADRTDHEVYVTPLTAAVMTFFNTSKPILNDVAVRQALIAGVDRSKLVMLSDFATELVDSPFLRDQTGYDPKVVQLSYNPERANKLLDEAGWIRNGDGQREKDGQPLQFALSSQNTPQYIMTAQFVQEEWAKLGVKIDVQYFSADELQGSVIANHDYDSIIYGISIGADPDVFAYWHSTQASVSSQGRLNLSEFKSKDADTSLEAGRTRTDSDLRELKYEGFLQAWVKGAPAMAMYQPNYLYVTRSPVFGYERKSANTSADRFYNVHNWMIRQERQNLE